MKTCGPTGEGCGKSYYVDGFIGMSFAAQRASEMPLFKGDALF